MADNPGMANKLMQQFLATHPEFVDALTSFVHDALLEAKASTSQDEQRALDEKHARDIHSMLLKLVANSKLEWNDFSDIP